MFRKSSLRSNEFALDSQDDTTFRLPTCSPLDIYFHSFYTDRQYRRIVKSNSEIINTKL